MEWTKETVSEKLKSNQKFKEIANEWQGPFLISYNIQGNTVWISNSVGGIPEAFIGEPFNMNTIHEACEFTIIAKDILKEIIKKQ